MSRILITGSSDGIGQLTAQLLIREGHRVILHARNPQRGEHAMSQCPGAERVVIADLSSIEETKKMAAEMNELTKESPLDAVIHNAGLGFQQKTRNDTVDGLPHVFAVNSLAPYVLTALMRRPKRLVYLSSGMHQQCGGTLADMTWTEREWRGAPAYSETKFQNILLANAVARKWPNVPSNSLHPGWVPTKMGTRAAPESLEDSFKTQVWLATAPEAEKFTGKYWKHMTQLQPRKEALDEKLQDQFLKRCEELSGVKFPDSEGASL